MRFCTLNSIHLRDRDAFVRAGSRLIVMVQSVKTAEQIRAGFAERLEGMRKALANRGEGLTDRDILAIRPLRCYDLEFSTGDPADWVRFFLDGEGDLCRVEYHYADQWTYEQVKLTYEEEETLRAWMNHSVRVEE